MRNHEAPGPYHAPPHQGAIDSGFHDEYLSLLENLKLLCYEEYRAEQGVGIKTILVDLIDVISIIIDEVYSPENNFLLHQESYGLIIYVINTLYHHIGTQLENDDKEIFLIEIGALHDLLYNYWTPYFLIEKASISLCKEFLLSFLDYTLSAFSDNNAEPDEAEKFVNSMCVIFRQRPFSQDYNTLFSAKQLHCIQEILLSENKSIGKKTSLLRVACRKNNSSVLEHSVLYMMEIRMKLLSVLRMLDAIKSYDLTYDKKYLEGMKLDLDYQYYHRKTALCSIEAIYDIDSGQYKDEFLASFCNKLNGRDVLIIIMLFKALQSLIVIETWGAPSVLAYLKALPETKNIAHQEIASIFQKIFNLNPSNLLTLKMISEKIEILGIQGVTQLVCQIFHFKMGCHQSYLRYHPECQLTTALVADSKVIYKELFTLNKNVEETLLSLSYFFKVPPITTPQLISPSNYGLLNFMSNEVPLRARKKRLKNGFSSIEADFISESPQEVVIEKRILLSR